MSLRVPPAPPSSLAPASEPDRATLLPLSCTVLQLSRAANSATRGHGRLPPVVLCFGLPPLSSCAAPVALFRSPVSRHGRASSSCFARARLPDSPVASGDLAG